jgi:channel protein (hemolysin III family)
VLALLYLFYGLERNPVGGSLGDRWLGFALDLVTLYGLDRTGIYLLIAGTYTPLCLIPLRGVWGWTLLGITWWLVLIGITVDWVTQCMAAHWLQGVLFVLVG